MYLTPRLQTAFACALLLALLAPAYHARAQQSAQQPSQQQQTPSQPQQTQSQQQAQPQPQPAANQSETAPEITAADVEDRLKQVQANTGLEETLKNDLTNAYNQALAALKQAQDYRAQAADYANLIQTAPQRIADLQVSLQEPVPNNVQPEVPEGATLAQLNQQQTDAERQLQDARSKLDELQQESTRRVDRRKQIPDLIAKARQQLNDMQSAVTAAANVKPERVEANRILNRAQTQMLNAQIQALNEELASYDARGRLLTLRTQEAQRNVSLAERRLDAWKTVVAKRTEEEAEQAAREARQRVLEATNAPPQIRDYAQKLAEENANLAERLTGTNGLIQQTTQAEDKKTQIQNELQRLSSEFDLVRKREEAVGLTNAIGQSLRSYRANLPSARQYESDLRLRRQTIGEVQLEQIDVQEQYNKLADPTRVIDQQLAIVSFAGETSQRQEDRLRSLLNELINAKKNTLSQVLDQYDKYLNALLDLNAAEQQLLAERNDFASYIDERVLWIRSGSPLSIKDATDAFAAFRWLADWRKWVDVANTLFAELRGHPVLNGFMILLFLAWGFAQPRLRKRVRDVGQKAEKRHCTNYWYTLEATLHTVLIAAFIPAIIAYVAWRIGEAIQAGEFTRVLATSLQATAFVYLTFEFPRNVSRGMGLGEAHFDWPDSATASLRRSLGWAMPIALPLVLLIAIFENQGEPAWRESIGQILFIALMLVWAALGHRLARKHAPAAKLLTELIGTGRNEGIKRLFYLITVAGPVALGIAAGLGYYYTTLRLAWRVYISLAFVFLVIVVVGLAMRALLIARRNLAIEQAKKKRKELLAAQKKAKESAEKAPAIETEEPALDLSLVDVQTTRLIRSVAAIALFAGLWFIWIDFVPALGILNQITVWESHTQVASETGIENLASTATGQASSAQSATQGVSQTAASAATSTVTKRITLADLLFALVVGILTVIAFRNLPGLLEIALLQRLPLAPGERYAIKTVLGYILVIVGIAVALGAIGLNWSSIQWLVAALGLGIGFGLQEIFANFVSGLIILFEQPIRVGDVVTIGDVSGTVTRIRIRATTIMDWDRKELVMPNKEFVTGKLINWTLSDSILRVTIPVGVAYGSDTELVRQTLKDTVERNARVLKDPAPQILFLGFDDSSLFFNARVFINDVTNLLPVKDELHHAIAKTFAEKHIEIAFPQRDIHIRSISAPLAVQSAQEQPVPLELEQQ